MPPKMTTEPPPTPAESIAENDSQPRRLPQPPQQFTHPPPSPPPTNSLAPTITEHDEETILGQSTPLPPAPPVPQRAPPPVPETVPAVKVSGTVSPPVFSDAGSSVVSAFLHSQFTHRDQESIPTPAAAVQLDRRATTGNQRTPPAPMVAVPPAPASVSFGEIITRPSGSSSPGVSLKEVGKVGSHLGKNPVDYLKPNGGLMAPVSPYFHPTHDPGSLDQPPEDVEGEGIFGNLNFLLESYLTILSSGGSIAVGTGYRSVARRLLERVEGMFARDLGVQGVGWADVLENIRGERSKPPLCIIPVRGLLSRKEEEAKTEINGGVEEPVDTKDLAESVVAGIKTKPAMGKVAEWLEQVGQVLKEEEGATAHAAAITREQEEEEDRIVCEIIEGILIKNTEASQCTQFREYLEDAPLIASSRLALSRLYPENPADSITPPIVALFLLLNPELHPLLHAISNVTVPELDLINSGRFDAFLDGATNVVARDEEEELATISALDKRLWSVLESLENQIEDLHTRALVVRRAIKSRKDLISRKQKLVPERSPTSRSASPAPKVVVKEEQADEDDWARNVPTLHLPITPDDSASNIASNRRRRKERASALDDAATSSSRSKSKREKSSRLKKVEEETTTGTSKPFSPQRISVREHSGTVVEGESEMGETGVSRRRRKREKGEAGSASRMRSRSKSRHRPEREGEKRERKHHHHREDRERGEKETQRDEGGKEKGKKSS